MPAPGHPPPGRPLSGGPLSRPVAVSKLPPGGLDVRVETTAAEREAIAADLGLPGVPALEGRFTLVPGRRGVHVMGRVVAIVVQTCGVSLEPFEARVEEAVDLRFADDPATAVPTSADDDPPEPIVAGRIDLGAVTQEFLALGLDPYPRKPGVELEAAGDEVAEDSPFAALARLRTTPDG